jgi:hypothetical protein
MNIEYTYEIIKVDEADRCMEVVYKSDGRQTMHIGARLPFVGETLESIVEMFSPVAYWTSLETPVVVPSIGSGGTISPAAIVEPMQPTVVTTFTVDEVTA